MAIETPSDRDFACFACVVGKHNDLAASCPKCGKPLNVGPLFVGLSVDGFKLEQYINRGHYGATLRGRNQIGRSAAIKLVPKLLYETRGKNFYEEIARYSSLCPHPNIAELYNAGEVTLPIFATQIDFYFVVMEWIEGRTFSEFIATERIDASIAYGAILDLTAGIARFEEANLWHNDLNGENILVKHLTKEEIQVRRSESPFILKIVDTGSAVFRLAFQRQHLTDLTFLGQHTNALRLAADSRRKSSPREDRFFLDGLESVASSLLDEDPSRRLSVGVSVSQLVTKIYKDSFALAEDSIVKLESPFDYLNANDFPNDTFVNRLFSDEFPWIREEIIPAAQSILITGPRGSGKTMILRSMRLRARMAPIGQNETPDQIKARILADPYIGFFISARLEIGNQAPLTKLPYWMTSEELVLYFFHLLYLYEICDTIHQASLKGVFNISPAAELLFCRFIGSALGEPVVTMHAGLSLIKEHQSKITSTRETISPPDRLISGTFLTEVCENIKILLPEFAPKKIVFLLDDFSLPKIPEYVQKTVLPIIWNSGGGYIFRVTAHSESIVIVDNRDNVYKADREYREFNLGTLYLASIDAVDRNRSIQNCVEDIFSRRFALSASSLKWKPKRLLGNSKTESIGTEIKSRMVSNKLRGLRFHGWDTVVALCSGDISYLIDLFGKMLQEHHHDRSKSAISTPIQNRAIRLYARTELYRLQDFPWTQCNLYEVALNFGKISRFKLAHEEVKDGEKHRPAEYLRIEVQMQNATPEVRATIAELLRNGVFIDGGFSSSSQGVPARRLIFKKLFTPAFPTTYRSRDTFPMTVQHFQEFCKNPSGFALRILGQSGIRPADQQLTLDGLLDRGT